MSLFGRFLKGKSESGATAEQPPQVSKSGIPVVKGISLGLQRQSRLTYGKPSSRPRISQPNRQNSFMKLPYLSHEIRMEPCADLISACFTKR